VSERTAMGAGVRQGLGRICQDRPSMAEVTI
jgi:hypothetical protein